MSHSPEQIAFAHELKRKLSALRPALDAESLAAQFNRAFEGRFGVSGAELFDAEFEHVPASVQIKKVEVAPDAGDLAHNG